MRAEQFEFVDLTRPIVTDMPVYPAILKTYLGVHIPHRPIRGADEWSVMANVLMMSDHAGTHIDATIHFDPKGQGADRIPLEAVFGPATVLDFADRHPRAVVTRDDVRAGLDRLNVAPGDVRILLFRTGADPHYGTERYIEHYLEIHKGAVEWMTDHGISVFGVDAITVDGPPDTPTHMYVRKREFYIIENLTNLDRLLGRRFTFIGLPLKLQGASDAPMRAVALLEKGA